MADLRAFEAVSEGVFGILRHARSRVGLSEQPEFKTVTGPDMLIRPVTMGVTLLTHEIVAQPGGHTAPPSSSGTSVPQAILYEMRFLMSIWAPEGTVEQRLAAWVADSLARQPLLLPEDLNASTPDCFGAEERVTVTPLAIPFADLMALWSALGGGRFRLSLPYVATGIRIVSE